MKSEEILELLPYSEPFRFVDDILRIDEDGCEGEYLFNEDLSFYRGHFKEFPITPGVILTECCAQIGLVCLGIYLLNKEEQSNKEALQIAMSSTEMEFLKAVYPNQKVRVRSEKLYFRFSKLKCKVSMYDANNQLICKVTIAGMLKINKDA